MKKFLINAELLNEIQQYLATKPFSEVFSIFQKLTTVRLFEPEAEVQEEESPE